MSRWQVIKAFSIGAVIWFAFMTTVTLLFVSLITKCHAADMLIGGYSYHFEKPDPEFGEPEKYNEKNPMLGLQSDVWSVVVFQNSYDKTSLAVFARKEVDINKHFSTFLAGGVASGYQDSELPKQGEFALMGFVGVDCHVGDLGVVVMANTHLVNIGLRIKL